MNALDSARCAALALTLALSAPPASPGANPAVIAACDYPDDAAAANAWKPMKGSAPAASATVAGRKALRLRCNFEGTDHQRASWDLDCDIDLADCRGIRFDVFCTNATPVSYFNIYFQSEGGWYSAPFHPDSPDGWSTFTLPKAATRAEGNPAGWGKIRAIRISAWRAESRDTEFFIADIQKVGTLGADASVAIIRAESSAAKRPSEAESIDRFAETVAEALDREGIPNATLGDLDVTPERLARVKLAILPHNPSIPDPAAEAIRSFVASGGKLLVFYSIPSQLRPLFNVGRAEHVSGAAAPRFASIRFGQGAMPGAPATVIQRSWGIHGLSQLPPSCRVLAEWFDEAGQPTGYPAVVAVPNALLMTHVLLPDDPANKGRMLLAMVGSLVPDIWASAARARIAGVGRTTGHASFAEAAKAIRDAAPDDPRTSGALASAEKALASATANLEKDRHIEAVDDATVAARHTLEAHCMSKRPAGTEFRAFWCHSASGVTGMDWDAAVRRLADNGFTAILPNMLWGGVAYYPSDILPTHGSVATQGDQVAACLAACRKHGIQMHVWKVNWNTGHQAPKEFVERMRAAGRLQADASGKVEPWLCPSHPDNQKLEVDSMLEVARKYGVDGLHFDYIRYPDGNHCFCDGCRARFEKASGSALSRWPADVLGPGPRRQEWLDWRRSNITAVVRAVSEGARAIRPGIRLSAAVFRNWSTDRDSVGQDWKLWCDRGYLDFLCPMDYTPSDTAFENMVKRQIEWAGKVPCYPGIGVSTWASPDPVRTIAQIEVARSLGCRGFTIFNYAAAEANDLVPLLGLGITRKPSAPKTP
ncbi:MAG: family 10 glycosylhydrolase [Verrucomicrobiae bacterium]|nr:family 10 glycosylhydrolase [Verrucomicrobiae bacterium]